MTATRWKQITLSMFIINTIAAVVAPMVIFAMLGVGRVASMGRYKDLEGNGVIATNAEKAKVYPNAQLNGDWGEVSLYLTEGFQDLGRPAYGVAIIFAINAVAFFLIWRSSRETPFADGTRGTATDAPNKFIQLDYASPPALAEERPKG